MVNTAYLGNSAYPTGLSDVSAQAGSRMSLNNVSLVGTLTNTGTIDSNSTADFVGGALLVPSNTTTSLNSATVTTQNFFSVMSSSAASALIVVRINDVGFAFISDFTFNAAA